MRVGVDRFAHPRRRNLGTGAIWVRRCTRHRLHLCRLRQACVRQVTPSVALHLSSGSGWHGSCACSGRRRTGFRSPASCRSTKLAAPRCLIRGATWLGSCDDDRVDPQRVHSLRLLWAPAIDCSGPGTGHPERHTGDTRRCLHDLALDQRPERVGAKGRESASPR